MNSSLLVGEEALSLLRASKFIAKWKDLAGISTGFTRLQEPEFVLSWYSLYKELYEPVLSVSLDNDNTPMAMMCLAYKRETQVLTHVGHNNAEYHGWLAHPRLEKDFLQETIDLVNQKFNLKKWNWRWMPPAANPDWLKSLKSKKVYLHTEQRNSPIWNLSLPEKLQKLKRSRSLKSKINRLKKRGNLQFRQIKEVKELTNVLNTVKDQSDFRQEAINDSRPFGDNPQKIPFYAALLSFPDTMHASGLWLDDKLLAFHIGITDKERICLGTISFDPSESSYSPGTLLMVKLAEELVDQGYKIFDLTPGTDAYKQRFSNEQQVLYRPSLSFSLSEIFYSRLKFSALLVLRKMLAFFGANIYRFKHWANSIKELRYKIHHLGLLKTMGSFLKGFYNVKKLGIYSTDLMPREPKPSDDNPINIQRYEDLMVYKKFGPWASRRVLLTRALNRFNKKEILLSITKNNELQWFCWQTLAQNFISVEGFSRRIKLENEGCILHDFYCEENAAFYEYLQLAIQAIYKEETPVFVMLDVSGKIIRNKLEGLGLGLIKQVYCIQILWLFKFIRTTK